MHYIPLQPTGKGLEYFNHLVSWFVSLFASQRTQHKSYKLYEGHIPHRVGSTCGSSFSKMIWVMTPCLVSYFLATFGHYGQPNSKIIHQVRIVFLHRQGLTSGSVCKDCPYPHWDSGFFLGFFLTIFGFGFLIEGLCSFRICLFFSKPLFYVSFFLTKTMNFQGKYVLLFLIS